MEKYLGKDPQIDPTAYVSKNAVLMGDIKIGKNASVWPGCVLRADINSIELGENSNIQDGTMVHLADDAGVKIGKNTTIGHGAIIHACTIGDGCLIGHQVVIATLNHDPSPETRASMTPKKVTLGKNVWVGSHATILPGVNVGDGSIIAAGAVVTKDVPPGCVAAGVPARVIKRL